MQAASRSKEAPKAAAKTASKAEWEIEAPEIPADTPAHEETALALIPEAPVFAAPVNTKEVMAETEP